MHSVGINGYTLVLVVGLTAISVLTRAFFMLPRKPLPIPRWLSEALRYAPLAALVAVVAPEVLLRGGALVAQWRDAVLGATLAGALWYLWRRDILGTIVAGTAVLLALRLGLGWA